jgi:hypothetical protein
VVGDFGVICHLLSKGELAQAVPGIKVKVTDCYLGFITQAISANFAPLKERSCLLAGCIFSVVLVVSLLMLKGMRGKKNSL